MVDQTTVTIEEAMRADWRRAVSEADDETLRRSERASKTKPIGISVTPTSTSGALMRSQQSLGIERTWR